MNKLIILRGVPGSFKSTYAQRVKAKMKGIYGISVAVVSADHYFTKNGIYTYDRAKIGKAHEDCRDKARKAMLHGAPYVMIDNCNVKRADFAEYIRLAKEFGYQIIEKVFGLDLSIDELHARNQHNVPRNKIELMAQKLEDSVRNVEGQTIKKVNGILTVEIKR